MKIIDEIKDLASALSLHGIKQNVENFVHEAKIEKSEYLDFLHLILTNEVEIKEHNKLKARLKRASLPLKYELNDYDYPHDAGISKTELKTLRTLVWMEQCYNLVLMGPSGIGKTYIAAGLVYDAVNMGYSAYFKTMGQLMEIIKLKEITTIARNKYKGLIKAHLIAIDDVMLFPMKKADAIGFFNFINQIHESCSIIITTNKSPQQWAELLEDEVLAAALLDRILFHCEVIKLNGRSYRMENRKTIFNNQCSEPTK